MAPTFCRQRHGRGLRSRLLTDQQRQKRPGHEEHSYKLQGTVNLRAALDLATTIARGKSTQTKNRADFQPFTDEAIQDQPAGRQIHGILDNLNTYKKSNEWLAAHPNVTFHFTPTSASWLNQVEIGFANFQRKTLENTRPASIKQLSN